MSLTTEVTQSGPRPNRWLGLAVLMLPVLLVTVDNTVLGFALPKIAEALHPTASQQLWMIDAYSLVLAGLLVSMGSLGDRIGHRKLLLVGSFGFAITSIMTAYSSSAPQLIGGRACMGIFGAMLMPSTLALIRSVFEDREERRLAVAIWATTLTVGSALGPFIGGVLLEFFSWGAIFLLAVPILMPLLILGPWLLPESEPDASGPLDPLSILQSMIALGALVYGIKHVAGEGVDSLAMTAFVVGAASGWLFVRRQLRLPVPVALLNIGVGAIATVSNDVILSAAPPAKAGAASAISETAYEVGVVLGTAVLGGLVTAHYRGALHLPSFLTPAQERLASETLAGAHSVAAALTGDQASELMRIAGNAFEGGIGLMSWVTFALAVMAIAIARWTLRVR
ncbi:MFS transporter [Pseudomonas guariconensis]|uniref:MFS transporter n=1 Tax=Pseudomonas guariconensis TaxID=1288410 RepID=UPI002B05F8A8|nr:MFS transporter [Pseudomonas guariconensis]